MLLVVRLLKKFQLVLHILSQLFQFLIDSRIDRIEMGLAAVQYAHLWVGHEHLVCFSIPTFHYD